MGKINIDETRGVDVILHIENHHITLREQLTQRPFTLSLSAGFFGFYAHAGLVSVLEDEQLLPERLTGCSAGSLIGGLWASGCQINELKDFLFSLKRQDFWDPAFGWGLLSGQRFDQILRDLLGCSLFEDTHIPIQMAVFDLSTRQTRYLDSGDLALAIRASCAFPGLFQPVQIEDQRYLDGGILDRSGMGGIKASEVILYHHLKSRSKIRLGASVIEQTHRSSTLLELSIDGLTKVSPFRLHRGQSAFQETRNYFQQQLDQPARLLHR